MHEVQLSFPGRTQDALNQEYSKLESLDRKQRRQATRDRANNRVTILTVGKRPIDPSPEDMNSRLPKEPRLEDSSDDERHDNDGDTEIDRQVQHPQDPSPKSQYTPRSLNDPNTTPIFAQPDALAHSDTPSNTVSATSLPSGPNAVAAPVSGGSQPTPNLPRAVQSDKQSSVEASSSILPASHPHTTGSSGMKAKASRGNQWTKRADVRKRLELNNGSNEVPSAAASLEHGHDSLPESPARNDVPMDSPQQPLLPAAASRPKKEKAAKLQDMSFPSFISPPAEGLTETQCLDGVLQLLVHYAQIQSKKLKVQSDASEENAALKRKIENLESRLDAQSKDLEALELSGSTRLAAMEKQMEEVRKETQRAATIVYLFEDFSKRAAAANLGNVQGEQSTATPETA